MRQFIFSSTAAVYGNAEHNPVREDAPTLPISPYGTSKLMSEIMLHDAGKAHGLRFVVLRYFNVAGADPKLRTGQATAGATHLIKVACEAALGKRPKIDIFGTDYPTPDGTCIRDYIHVADLADAHVRALKYLLSGGATCALNLANAHGYSVKEVIETAERVCGRKILVKIAPRRPGDPPSLIGSGERARAVLGWVPARSALEVQIADAWNWMQKSKT